MNDLIRASIDARKMAIYNFYDITDEVIIEEIDNLFDRIYAFGENCVDVEDFEVKFAKSRLNQEYIELFAKIGTICNQRVVVNTENNDIKSDGEYILDDFTSEIKYQMESSTQPIRGKIYREVYDKARDIPVVGDALNVKQHLDLFGKFKKKKEDKDNNIENK